VKFRFRILTVVSALSLLILAGCGSEQRKAAQTAAEAAQQDVMATNQEVSRAADKLLAEIQELQNANLEQQVQLREQFANLTTLSNELNRLKGNADNKIADAETAAASDAASSGSELRLGKLLLYVFYAIIILIIIMLLIHLFRPKDDFDDDDEFAAFDDDFGFDDDDFGDDDFGDDAKKDESADDAAAEEDSDGDDKK